MAAKHIAIALVGLTLSACMSTTQEAPGYGVVASGRPPESVVDHRGELRPQELQPGECGTFFWSANSQHRFLAYNNVTRGVVRVHADGQMHEFWTGLDDVNFALGETYRQTVGNIRFGVEVELEGEISEELMQGLRIAPALMRVTRQDGQRIVVPLRGIYTCQFNG